MMIRKFRRDELDSEPHNVRFKDIYPWDAIEQTPFSASLVVVEPGGVTMMHSHHPAETFIICSGRGTMTVDRETREVGTGDVVYLPPRSVHSLRNDSDREELMFLSVFWNEEQRPSRPEQKPRFIIPSPPTPNGPLHAGHLAGPYLLADVMRRYFRSRGIEATFVLVSDEHQSFVARRAQIEGCAPLELAAGWSEEAIATLRAFHAAPDVTIFPSRDRAHQAAIRERVHRLFTLGLLEARETDALFCKRCDRVLYDAYVAGKCPHCGSIAPGFACERCCLPNQNVDLVDPECTVCRERPARVRRTRLFFPIDRFRDRLARYHDRLLLSPRLRSLAARMRALPELVAPASQIGTWGIALELDGFEGQVISPWFEIALATIGLKEESMPQGEAVSFFGCDNAFLYLFHDPAITMALDAEPAMYLAANEYLTLDDRKMSTSSGEAPAAREVLEQIPADLLRISLAAVRPATSPTSWSLSAANEILNVQVIDKWHDWLETLAESVKAEAGARVPSPAAWSPEHADFLWTLETLLDRAKQSYERFSLTEVAWVVHELVHRAVIFGASGSHLAGVTGLEKERATCLALELAAVRTLALVVAPLMPGIGRQLFRWLGYEKEEGWSDGVKLLIPGQELSLAPIRWERHDSFDR